MAHEGRRTIKLSYRAGIMLRRTRLVDNQPFSEIARDRISYIHSARHLTRRKPLNSLSKVLISRSAWVAVHGRPSQTSTTTPSVLRNSGFCPRAAGSLRGSRADPRHRGAPGCRSAARACRCPRRRSPSRRTETPDRLDAPEDGSCRGSAPAPAPARGCARRWCAPGSSTDDCATWWSPNAACSRTCGPACRARVVRHVLRVAVGLAAVPQHLHRSSRSCGRSRPGRPGRRPAVGVEVDAAVEQDQ